MQIYARPLYEVHKRPTELCVRWDYNAETDGWESSETLIKMEDVSFAHGAMRECYRMKKMSQVNAHFFYKMKWEDCNNYVAKRYIAADTPVSAARVRPTPQPHMKAPAH